MTKYGKSDIMGGREIEKLEFASENKVEQRWNNDA